MWEGRPLTLDWQRSFTLPPREHVTQASGVCFTEGGLIVLVAGSDHVYGLPGGHPEPDETIEQALVREVAEEACAVVQQSCYLGAVEVHDPFSPAGPTRYYQARFWARVRLQPFMPAFETTQRLLVRPESFLATLSWGTTKLAHVLFQAAMEVENGIRGNTAKICVPNQDHT
jgi:8-oxo-dGTP pyrophosphatase MutT (NUDIX family)